MRDTTTGYYLDEAVQALEAAYALNRDSVIAARISQALDALRQLQRLTAAMPHPFQQAASDPYEMDDYNSAV